jgi:outer membrane immunogenic protein
MRIGFASVVVMALIAAGSAASAQTSPTPFGGAYIGLNAGAGWGSARYATDPGCPPSSIAAAFCNSDDATVVNGQVVAASGTGELTPVGFTGGIQGGYNWQYGNIVYGGEGDFGALSLDKSVDVPGNFPPTGLFAGTTYLLHESMSTSWLITLRGRVGYTVTPYLLLYGTGGLALTDFKFSSSYSDNANNGVVFGGTGFGERSEVKAGWVIGGGGEWLLDGRWSIKAEYLYLDFGSTNLPVVVTNSPAFAQTMVVDTDLSAQVARIGINFRP